MNPKCEKRRPTDRVTVRMKLLRMNSDRPPATCTLIEERDVRECLPTGRCVPKLEKPIMERIMESESSSDIFGVGGGWTYDRLPSVGRFVKVIVIQKLKTLFAEMMLSNSVRFTRFLGTR